MLFLQVCHLAKKMWQTAFTLPTSHCLLIHIHDQILSVINENTLYLHHIPQDHEFLLQSKHNAYNACYEFPKSTYTHPCESFSWTTQYIFGNAENCILRYPAPYAFNLLGNLFVHKNFLYAMAFARNGHFNRATLEWYKLYANKKAKHWEMEAPEWINVYGCCYYKDHVYVFGESSAKTGNVMVQQYNVRNRKCAKKFDTVQNMPSDIAKITCTHVEDDAQLVMHVQSANEYKEPLLGMFNLQTMQFTLVATCEQHSGVVHMVWTKKKRVYLVNGKLVQYLDIAPGYLQQEMWQYKMLMEHVYCDLSIITGNTN